MPESSNFEKYLALLEEFHKQAVMRREEELKRLGKTEAQLWHESAMYRHEHPR